eukprot:TRINITY_DN2045_c0_g10_i1.p1 TRINITY_DN2045_c0_g10~~TRINITY_DN2045_c0_g10_i1.p1  ORF type:complete len:199 (-),score=75.44 TRINITY_DN2045_c0_g10_i1:139-735(-)
MLEEVYISKFDTLDENLIQAIQNSCNQWAPGIEIISIRVTKPRIPKHIVNSYEQMEKEKTMQKIALETQKVTEVTAETRRIEANINAQMEADVSNIKVAKELNQTKSQIEKENILSNWSCEVDKMLIEKEQAMAKANTLSVMTEAEANELKFTEEFLILEKIKAFSKNTKLYLGPSIPKYISEGQAVPLVGSPSNKTE